MPALQLTNPTGQSAATAQFVLAPFQEVFEQFSHSLEQLYAQTNNPHPFLHPQCLQAFFKSQPHGQAAILHTGAQVHCAGFLDNWALHITSLPSPLPNWQLAGQRIFAKGLLWDGNDEHLQQWLQNVSSQLPLDHRTGLLIEALAVDTALWTSMQSLLQRDTDIQMLQPQALQPRRRLLLPATVEEYWDLQFKGKTRSTLRRKRKKLGDYKIQVVSDPDEIPEFLKHASAISEHTWQTRQLGLRIRNDDREQHLYRTLAERGGFRGYLLWLNQVPIVFVINTSHDDYLHYEETGFLPAYAHLSPGTVLVSEMIDDLINTGEYRTVDFGLGDADYKRLFTNQDTQSTDTWLLRQCPSSTLAMYCIQSQQLLKKTTIYTLKQLRLLNKCKKLKRAA